MQITRRLVEAYLNCKYKACFPLGLCLWNGLGPHFGLGAAGGNVDHRAAYAACGLLLVTLILELAVSSR